MRYISNASLVSSPEREPAALLQGRLEGLPGGKYIAIDMSPEMPVKVLPRGLQLTDVRFHDSAFETHPLLLDMLTLVSKGQGMIREPVFTRQFIEKRSRSLSLMDPVSENIISLAGFGLVRDMRFFDKSSRIEAGIPLGSRNLEELDYGMEGLGAVVMGNLQYQADGSVFRSGGDEPLGGYNLEALRKKIETNRQAQDILAGYAQVPNWLFSAGYADLRDKKGRMLGMGAYELPPHLYEAQLAELSIWLKLQGVNNKLYEQFIFRANMAARAMHEQDFVHSQLHRGNVFADLRNDLMPVITDFTTARSIRDFGRIPLERTGWHSPFNANKFLDIEILNSNLIKALMQAQNYAETTDQGIFLGILPGRYKGNVPILDNLTSTFAWAYAAHLSPDGQMPSDETIAYYFSVLKPRINSLLREHRDPNNPVTSIETVVQAISIDLVEGMDPQPWSDKSKVQMIRELRDSFKPKQNRRRH